MRLKQLDLHGYKSFASRSVFEFTSGITAIVGPNGSGKSNIADAIRWVMGEQSYRNLRGRSTEDMIFAGSRTRPRQGMAEVILTLDNSDGWLPIDYTEVTVGRRAYRSGENEYLLNNNRVRYRDVLDILNSAGLARSNYTVIGQGMVDAALALRPEARRALFEDAAGITPHLRKREEALRRIQETERNLERVNDILNELRPRATSLRRQAERAEEYILLSQDLQELQRIWYGYQWQRNRRNLARAEERLREQRARIDSHREYHRGFQEKQEQIVAQQNQVRQVIADLRRRETALREDTERLRRELAVANERGRLHRQQRQVIEGEIRALTSRRDILQSEIARAAEELAEHEAQYQAAHAELEAARAELLTIDDERRSLDRRVRDEQKRLDAATAAIAECRARIEQITERREQLAAARDDAEAQITEIDRRLKEAEAHGRTLQEREEALEAECDALRQEGDDLEKQIERTREELAVAEKNLIQARAERDRLLARQEALARIRQELTGYVPGVREVLAAGSNSLEGILGTVATLMNVPGELEAAIEAALGARLQNVVTERWEHAEAAIAYLKRTRAGWATFLPLDTVRPRQVLNIRSEPDIVGVGSALVRYEERLRPVFELLLGRILIVRDLTAARRLLRSRTGASLFVTLEGETVQPGGVLSGGTRKSSGPNLLAQEREWRELPDRIATAEARLDEFARAHAEAQDLLTDLRRRVQEQERRLTQLRSERDAAREAGARHAQSIREMTRDRDWQTNQMERTRQELATLDEREEKLRLRMAESDAEQAAATAALSELREALAAIEDGELRRRVGELETRAAVAQRTVQSQRRLMESHESNLAQLARQIEEKSEQDTHLAADMAALDREIERLNARSAAIEAENKAIDEQIHPAQEELSRLEAAQRDIEHRASQSLERLHESEIEANRIALERDRILDQQETLAREIESDLGPIDLPDTVSHQLRLSLDDDVVELPQVTSLPPGLGDEVRQLKTRIRRLGNVNVDAPREYEQLLDRQTFLQGQASDLRGAIASLHEVIQELDAIIERDFVATVEKVNEAFGEYFRVLFGGGNARLILTDPENPSTTGVDIIAHPPGKRAQGLALLSGGERSLTAVALLFALLRANPVPFCFLDEVDAALDEANVNRFRDLLVQHAEDTQFIIITHNRRTIEVASTIYGITMSEQGVSQCISLKLDDVHEPTASQKLGPLQG
jgi:chromosome segregation protein